MSFKCKVVEVELFVTWPFFGMCPGESDAVLPQLFVPPGGLLIHGGDRRVRMRKVRSSVHLIIYSLTQPLLRMLIQVFTH